MEDSPKNLSDLLDKIRESAEGGEKVSLDEIMDAVGRRSFGPLLLMAGVFVSAPGIADIPGVPTIIGLFVLVLSIQLVFGIDHFWLPAWLLKRRVKSKTIEKMTESKWVRKPAKFVDQLLKERLAVLTGRPAMVIIALVCVATMLVMPLTEIVPLSANIVGASLVAFGLALMANDGLMTLLGFVISAVAIAVAILGVG